MNKNYARRTDKASPRATGSFCAHNPAGTSASTSEYECAAYPCALINNKKDTLLAVSFSLIALFIFMFLIAIPIFGVTLVQNPILVFGDIIVFHLIILSMIRSNGLYRS